MNVAIVKSKLAAKILLMIVAVLIVGFGASTIWTIRRQADILVEQNKTAARRITAALVASIEGAMLQERPDVTRTVIQELRTRFAHGGVDIFRRNGVEAFTDLETATFVDKNAGLAPAVMANIKKMARPPGESLTGPLFTRAVQTLQTQEALQERDGLPIFTLYQPIENQERCQGCHGTDHKVRAVVRVTTSMESVFAQVRANRNRQIFVAVLTILAAGGILAVAMGRIVVQPLHQLSAVARRIGQGDFHARASADSHDEIGELGGAINDMTSRLAQAYADLETKNQELEGALHDLQESRQRLVLLEQLKGELSKFVPDAVKKLLERSPDATELEKRNVEVSVLFLDIAGYTKLSEQLEPRKLNQMIQTYFSSYLEIIQAHHGDISETAGDGLMVIFESERGVTDHGLNATRAAFAIRQRTEALNEEYGGMFPPVQLHMGINTGDALVGATKLGGAGAQRWTFTASGSTTNVAARFAASAVGGEIIVGPPTAERIRGAFVLESLGDRTFKNVSAPIHVYRVIPPGIYEKIT